MSNYLLKGLLFCHICDKPLQGRIASNGYRIYLCKNGVADGETESCKHTIVVKASVAEKQVLDATRQLLADPWRIADIWHGLQDDPHGKDSPEVALDVFTQRTQLALQARDFQTRRDLLTFFIRRIVVSDDAFVIGHVVPTREYGHFARATDDFVALVRHQIEQLRWTISHQHLSDLVQSRLTNAPRIFRRWFPLLYLGWLGFSGLLIAVGYIHAGLILDSLLIVVLLYLKGYMPIGNESRLAWVSALPPILRLLSYSVPVPDVSLDIQLTLVGIPALWATLIMMHAIGRPLSAYGISLHNFPAQLAIMPLGLLIGLLEWLLFGPQLAPIYADLASAEKWAFIALFITNVTEELVFRGLLQQGALALYGHVDYWGTGLVFANVAFASMHIGYGPIAIIFAFGTGLLYAILSHRTGSIFGILGAHGLSSIVLLVLLS